MAKKQAHKKRFKKQGPLPLHSRTPKKVVSKPGHIPSPEDYMILANLDGIGKGAVCRVLNRYAPNLTVCPECRVDDFTHVATCSILAKLSTP
jgi:hypothetical protein